MVIQRIVRSRDQLLARVEVARIETLRIGDLLPMYEGRRYRVIGVPRILGGPVGAWRADAHGTIVRTEEVVVAENVEHPERTEASIKAEAAAKRRRK